MVFPSFQITFLSAQWGFRCHFRRWIERYGVQYVYQAFLDPAMVAVEFGFGLLCVWLSTTLVLAVLTCFGGKLSFVVDNSFQNRHSLCQGTGSCHSFNFNYTRNALDSTTWSCKTLCTFPIAQMEIQWHFDRSIGDKPMMHYQRMSTLDNPRAFQGWGSVLHDGL